MSCGGLRTLRDGLTCGFAEDQAFMFRVPLGLRGFLDEILGIPFDRTEHVRNVSRRHDLKGVFVVVIVIYSISILIMFTAGVMEGAAEEFSSPQLMDYVDMLELIDNFVSLAVGIIILIQCFKVRRIFIDHFKNMPERKMKLSGLATFFFQIHYLQYKINRF